MSYRNCSVAGALMGCKFGFNQLPEELMMMMIGEHRKIFDQKLQKFLSTLQLN